MGEYFNNVTYYTYNIMQVKCDECESWYHQRCISLRTSMQYDTKYYENAKFVGACCSSDREFQLQI